MRIAGLIMAGGQSTRMGAGIDKLTLTVAGRSMLAHTAAALEQGLVAARATGGIHEPAVLVMAIGNRRTDNLDMPGQCLVIPDSGQGGPLEGMIKSMDWVVQNGLAQGVVIVGGDMPLIVPGVVVGLIERLRQAPPTVAAVVPRIDGLWHPLLAAYRAVETLAAAQTVWQAGQRAITDVLAALETQAVGESEFRELDESLRSLSNINTPPDWQGFVAHLTGEQPP